MDSSHTSSHFTTYGESLALCDMHTFCVERAQQQPHRARYSTISGVIKGETRSKFVALKALFTNGDNNIQCTDYLLSDIKMAEILLSDVTRIPNTDTYITFQVDGDIKVKFHLQRTDSKKYSTLTTSWACDLYLTTGSVSLKLLGQDGMWFSPHSDDMERATSFRCLMSEVGRVFETYAEIISRCAMLILKNYPHLCM